ncbi:MAG: FeoB-associated Cys-rich membrane protein [Oscillospiraceae bacterium]|nr:FeoB-associated Cys-rich membrane protein [Oscillospiraceae bacterium]
MIDVVIGAVLLLILGAAAVYVIREKKRGSKCIGCPYSKNCSSGQSGCSCNHS